MVDLKEESLLSAVEQQQSMISNPSNSSTSQGSSGPLKSCTGCHTTTTPLWRGGPAGPKTLCNACGIKYHKKRRAMLGLESGKSDKAKSKKKISTKITVAREDYNNGSDEEDKFAIRVTSKIKMLMKRHIGGRKMREEEHAAVLLMALSQGSLCA